MISSLAVRIFYISSARIISYMPKKKARKTKQTQTVSPREKLKEQAKQFGKEAEALGKQMGVKGEEFGKRVRERTDGCCGRGAFGVVGLVFSIILGIVGLAISIWALNFLAQRTENSILYELHDFLLSNLGIFILIFLVSSALTYFSRCCRTGRMLVSPISAAFGITVFLWIASSIILINSGVMNSAIISAADYAKSHLLGLFWFFLIISYFFLFIQLIFEGISGVNRNIDNWSSLAMKEHRDSTAPNRLYRSGKDRILGGVCGGLAEYLGVDPVLIRLIWAVAVFFFGTGVLLYIICWIIIPRNPNHPW